MTFPLLFHYFDKTGRGGGDRSRSRRWICKQPEIHGFVACWIPDGPTAYAKAIVWRFVAGFPERFVPDILNRLGREDNKA